MAKRGPRIHLYLSSLEMTACGIGCLRCYDYPDYALKTTSFSEIRVSSTRADITCRACKTELEAKE